MCISITVGKHIFQISQYYVNHFAFRRKKMLETITDFEKKLEKMRKKI